MKNWVNIARKTILLATMLLISYCYAHAQNNSAEPYINSTHLYRVPMGDIGNDVEWYISNPNYNSGAAVELDAQAWITAQKIDNAVDSEDSAAIEITFVESIFMDAVSIIAGPWTLRYEEHDAGGGGCIAVRELAITPTANLFNLAVANLADDCNSFAGNVWDNTDDLTVDQTMEVTFFVDMAKALNHAVSEYTFTATVSESSANFSIPVAANDFIAIANRTGTSDYGDFEITNINTGAGTFDVRVYNLAGAGYETADQVEFNINLTGPAIYDLDVTLEIENGEAVSGTNYSVVTDENSTDDNDETHRLWGIPNTSIVSVSP